MTSITRLTVNENLKIEIFQGSHGKYYRMNDICYDIHFPIEWAKEHKNNF